MKVVIACAGSGGHINPGISIAQNILKHDKTSEIIFLGTKKGLENELVKKAGFNIKTIRAERFHRHITFENIRNIYLAYKGIGDARKIYSDFKPDLVIGTGGYICVPAMMAARQMHIPYILHESNVYPGVAVKINAKYAAKILLGFEETKKYLPYENTVYTGTPARFLPEDIDALNKLKCKKELNLKAKKILFVTGGSQGAKKINETIIQMVKKYMPDDFYIVLAVGHNNYDEVLKNVTVEMQKCIQVEKYVYDMDKMYKASDMLITRAGAMTVLELEIAAKPAILIPLPTAAENHQLYNAKMLEEAKAGIVIEEKDLNEDVLYGKIMEYMANTIELKQMGENARKLCKTDVDEVIWNEIKIYGEN